MGLRSSAARRIQVRPGDVLVINGHEISADILREIISPDKRLLWAFVRGANGRDIQPIPYDERLCIWLTQEDLHRTIDL